MTSATTSIPTSVGTYHTLTDRSRFRLGIVIEPAGAGGTWFWRPLSCFLRIHMHGPFPTVLAAWEDAVTNAVTRKAA